MRNIFKLGLVTLFSAFIFNICICEEASAKPGFDGIDENGHRVNVVNVDKYLKEKNAQESRNRLKKEVKAELKAEMKKEERSKHPSWSEANKRAVKGTIGGALLGAIVTPEAGGTGALPGGLIGGAAGYIDYFAEHVVGAD